jgi:hypothetical protein
MQKYFSKDLPDIPEGPGVYAIINTTNGKAYIGQSWASNGGLKARLTAHYLKLKKGKHPNKHLQGSWNTYGASAFLFTPLIYLERGNGLDSEEEAWIAFFNSGDPRYGYNSETVAHNYTRSDAARKAISDGLTGKPRLGSRGSVYINKDGLETRVPKELLESWVGEGWSVGRSKGSATKGKVFLVNPSGTRVAVLPEEVESKLLEGWSRLPKKPKPPKKEGPRKGWSPSAETREKQSKSKKENPPMAALGKKWVHKELESRYVAPEELQELLRQGWELGRPRASEETKRKQSEKRLGKKMKQWSKESKQRLSEAHKGKKVSDETRKRMSEAHRRR